MASSCGSIDGLTWLCFLETVGGETDYGSAFALERYVKGKGMIWVFFTSSYHSVTDAGARVSA